MCMVVRDWQYGTSIEQVISMLLNLTQGEILAWDVRTQLREDCSPCAWVRWCDCLSDLGCAKMHAKTSKTKHHTCVHTLQRLAPFHCSAQDKRVALVALLPGTVMCRVVILKYLQSLSVILTHTPTSRSPERTWFAKAKLSIFAHTLAI